MSPHVKAVCDRVTADMARQLLLEPAVDLTDAEACAARWREQRIAPIAIQEFGPEAKALAQTELHQLAGSAEQEAAMLVPPPAPMIGRRDGVRAPGNPSGGRDAA